MEGNIITVDYAQTNHLKVHEPPILSEPIVYDENKQAYVKKVYGYVVTAGMGMGGQTSWANLQQLDDHFYRHGKQFDSPNKTNYALQARVFYENRHRYQVKIDENGVLRVYDATTNTFGVYNADGETITFFKPSGGQRYFDSQPGQSIKGEKS